MTANGRTASGAAGQTSTDRVNNGGGDVSGNAAGGVNRKKQKRREKQAARQAAGQPDKHDHASQASFPGNGHAPRSDEYVLSPPLTSQHDLAYGDRHFDNGNHFDHEDGDDLYYSDEDAQLYQTPYDPGNVPANGHSMVSFLDGARAAAKKPKRKKKAKSSQMEPSTSLVPTPSSSHVPPGPPPPPPPLSNAATRPGHKMSRDIWDTSTQEERERIKEFWLSLGEEDRRSLVKVEKEAVLRKMKEQQKHSCSCTVCGRKRTAIEEELEVLYDAYYEELEQYANHQQTRLDDGLPSLPPPRRYGAAVGRLPHSDRLPPMGNAPRGQPPALPKTRLEELADNEDDEDEDYSDEEDEDEEYSEEDPEEEARGPAADFFNFGNSLTVQGPSAPALYEGRADRSIRWNPDRRRRPAQKRWEEVHRDDGATGGASDAARGRSSVRRVWTGSSLARPAWPRRPQPRPAPGRGRVRRGRRRRLR